MEKFDAFCIVLICKASGESIVIPIPNQGAFFVGSSSASQRTYLYAFVASILAALISSLI
jgi:hypothetical protein